MDDVAGCEELNALHNMLRPLAQYVLVEHRVPLADKALHIHELSVLEDEGGYFAGEGGYPALSSSETSRLELRDPSSLLWNNMDTHPPRFFGMRSWISVAAVPSIVKNVITDRHSTLLNSINTLKLPGESSIEQN